MFIVWYIKVNLRLFKKSIFFDIYKLVTPVRELSNDEKQTILLSSEFQKFVSRAGRVIERALAESVDIYTDYTGGGDNENAQLVLRVYIFT